MRVPSPGEMEGRPEGDLEGIWKRFLKEPNIKDGDRLDELLTYSLQAATALTEATSDEDTGGGGGGGWEALLLSSSVKIREVVSLLVKVLKVEFKRKKKSEDKVWKVLVLLLRIETWVHHRWCLAKSFNELAEPDFAYFSPRSEDFIKLLIQYFELTFRSIKPGGRVEASGNQEIWSFLGARNEDEFCDQWIGHRGIPGAVEELERHHQQQRPRKKERRRRPKLQRPTRSGFKENDQASSKVPSNLSGIEQELDGKGSGSEGSSAHTDFNLEAGSRSNFLLGLNPPNPMDFKYFETVVRSEDEALYLKLRSGPDDGQGSAAAAAAAAAPAAVEDDVGQVSKKVVTFSDQVDGANERVPHLSLKPDSYQIGAVTLCLLKMVCANKTILRFLRIGWAGVTDSAAMRLSCSVAPLVSKVSLENLANLFAAADKNPDKATTQRSFTLACLLEEMTTVGLLMSLVVGCCPGASSASSACGSRAMDYCEKLLALYGNCEARKASHVVRISMNLMRTFKLSLIYTARLSRTVGGNWTFLRDNFEFLNWFCSANGFRMIDGCFNALLKNGGAISGRDISVVATSVCSFLEDAEVCEVKLLRNCKNVETIRQVTAFSRKLVDYFRELRLASDPDEFKTALPHLLRSLHFQNGAPCCHPLRLWGTILSFVAAGNDEDPAPPPEARRLAFAIIEDTARHYFVHHHQDDKVLLKAGSSGGDEAFAFLPVYAGLIDVDCRQTIGHLTRILEVSPSQLQLILLDQVLLPASRHLAIVDIDVHKLASVLSTVRLLKMPTVENGQQESRIAAAALDAVLSFSKRKELRSHLLPCAFHLAHLEVSMALRRQALGFEVSGSRLASICDMLIRNDRIGAILGHLEAETLETMKLPDDDNQVEDEEQGGDVGDDAFEESLSQATFMWRLNVKLMASFPEFAHYFGSNADRAQLALNFYTFLLKSLTERCRFPAAGASTGSGRDKRTKKKTKSAVRRLRLVCDALSCLMKLFVLVSKRPNFHGVVERILGEARSHILGSFDPSRRAAPVPGNFLEASAVFNVLFSAATEPPSSVADSGDQKTPPRFPVLHTTMMESDGGSNGYEGDSEDSDSDCHHHDYHHRLERLPPSLVVNKDVIRFAMKLLAQIFRCEDDLIDDRALSIRYGMSKLLELTMANGKNSKPLNDLDLSDFLFKNFLLDLLKTEEGQQQAPVELLDTVLDVMLELSKSGISGAHYENVVEFFKGYLEDDARKIPHLVARKLLEILKSAALASVPADEPSVFLEFPAPKDCLVPPRMARSISSVSRFNNDGQTDCAEQSFTNAALGFLVSSPSTLFSHSVKTRATVSTWIKVAPQPKTGGKGDGVKDAEEEGPQVHVLSFGSATCLCEVWLKKSSQLEVRVTSALLPSRVGSAVFLLSEVSPSSKFPYDSWIHLVLTCDTSKGDKVAEFQAVVNMQASAKLQVSLKSAHAALSRIKDHERAQMTRSRFGPTGSLWPSLNVSQDQVLLIGHRPSSAEDDATKSTTTTLRYSMGNAIHVFNSVLSDPAHCIALFLKGPDCPTLIKCAAQEHGVQFMRHKLASINGSFPQVDQGQVLAALDVMQRDLVAVFKVDRPEELLVYPSKPIIESGGLLSSLYYGRFYAGPTSGLDSCGYEHTAEPPILSLALQPHGRLNLVRRWKLNSLLARSSGTWRSVLLLLAAVVDVELGDEEVADCLEIILRLVTHSEETMNHFRLSNSLLLLRSLMRSDKCRASTKTADVLFKYSVAWSKKDEDEEPCCVVIDRELLRFLLLGTMKTWSRNGCVDHVISACLTLVVWTNGWRKFNASIFRDMDLVKNAAYSVLNGEVWSESAVQLLGSLLKETVEVPASKAFLTLLLETALLLQDAGLTHATNTRQSFYFYLSDSLHPVKINKKDKAKANSSNFLSSASFRQPRDSFKTPSSTATPETNGGAMTSSQESDDLSLMGSTNGHRSDLAVGPEKVSSCLTLKSSLTGKFSMDYSSGGLCSSPDHLLERPGKWGLQGHSECCNHNNASSSSRRRSDATPAASQDNAGSESSTSAAILLESVLAQISSQLRGLPDKMLVEVVSDVQLLEHALILVNNRNRRVREGAVNLIHIYVSRTSFLEPDGFKMLKANGYLILANQLHQYEASEAIVNSCLNMVFNTAETIDVRRSPEITDGPALENLRRRIRVPALTPLLALMPCSIQEVSLAHSLIQLVHELFAKVPDLLKYHRQLGLLETLCKTLSFLAHEGKVTTDVCGQDSRGIIFEDLHNFLRLIALRFVMAHGKDNWLAVKELLQLLAFMSLDDSCPSSVRTFRAAFCVVMDECLRDVYTRICQVDHAFSGGHNNHRGNNASNLRHHSSFFAEPDQQQLLEVGVDVLGTAADGGGLPDLHPPQQARRRHETGNSYTSVTTTRQNMTRASTWVMRGLDIDKLATRSDLMERFGLLISSIVEFFLCADLRSDELDPIEESLFASLLRFLVDEFLPTLDSGNGKKSSWISSLQRGAPKEQGRFLEVADIKSKVLSLINFALYPGSSDRLRSSAVSILLSYEKMGEILSALMLNNPMQLKITNTFVSLMQPTAEANAMRALVDAAGLNYPIEEQELADLMDQYRCQLLQNRDGYVKLVLDPMLKKTKSFDDVVISVTASSSKVTEASVEKQNEERKKMMMFIRDRLADTVTSRQLWQTTIDSSCHPGSHWYLSGASGKTWQLCETEGAHGIRIRFEKCFSPLPEKGYRKGFKDKGAKGVEGKRRPFEYLLVAPPGMSSVIISQLGARDRICKMEQCSLVLPAEAVAGEVLLSDANVHFVQSSTDLTTTDLVSFSVKLSDIHEVHERRHLLNDCAVELFLKGGFSKMLSFADAVQRDAFVSHIRSHLGAAPQNSQQFYESLKETQEQALMSGIRWASELWIEGRMTNFDYLMRLNRLAGRSFNDLMQYPVFPFVLANYTSETLDLLDPSNFRNLQRPIAIQDPAKEGKFRRDYRELELDAATSYGGESGEVARCGLNVGAYHYGSHYSNSGVVLHFLVRQLPFSALFYSYQDNSFDTGDRHFQSMEVAWLLASGKLSSDGKELVPDLFYLPEMFLNTEGLDLGSRQSSGEEVNAVKLPPYAQKQARLFVKIHRQALEAETVRNNLCHWIDLVFGYKQTGPEAVEAVNVYHPSTYYGFDLNSIKLETERNARAQMIKLYGQTPKQLFAKPHPQPRPIARDPPTSLLTSVFTNASQPHRLQQELLEPPFLAMDTLRGARWGWYVGSPTSPDPIIVWRTMHKSNVSHLIALSAHEVFGVPRFSAAIIQDIWSMPEPSLLTLTLPKKALAEDAVILGWNHPDKVVRMKGKKTEIPVPLLYVGDPALTVVQAGPESVWFGHETGRLSVLKFSSGREGLEFEFPPVHVFAHRSEITVISICPEFGIVVSVSRDGACVVWDTIKNPRHPIHVRTISVDFEPSALAISSVSGDIVVSGQRPGDPDDSSAVLLYTINGMEAAAMTCSPRVTCLAFSTLPEGVSINAVVTGHAAPSGLVRLWSSWDLRELRSIHTGKTTAISSVTYSKDNISLYVLTEENEVIVYENGYPEVKRSTAEAASSGRTPFSFFRFP